MDWRTKAAAQKALSVTPGGRWINDRLQTVVGGLRHFEVNVDRKVGDFAGTMRYLREAGISVEDAEIVEIGTGWYPALPLCLYLAGARYVHTYDIHAHLTTPLTLRLIELLGTQLDRIAAAAGIGLSRVESRFEPLRACRDVRAVLNAAGVRYHAPADVSNSGLPSESVDLVYSNSVLEHVPPEVLAPLFREAFRVLKNGGAILHNIACNDHYAMSDCSISYVNFLRYTSAEWNARWNNGLLFQNRLRPADFLNAAADAGFVVIVEHRASRPGVREALRTLKIAPEFQRYSAEDLASTTLDFVAVKRH